MDYADTILVNGYPVVCTSRSLLEGNIALIAIGLWSLLG